MLAVHSQHIHAEVTGWRTPKGLLLREPVKASVTYTPALAKSALLLLSTLSRKDMCRCGKSSSTTVMLT